MKNFLALFITALLCLGFSSFAVAELADVQAVQAQQGDAARMVELPIFTKSKVLDLPRNTASFWFSVPDGTMLSNDGIMLLHMEVSDTLINERSSITFLVNNEQLSTIRILDIIGDRNGWWQVTVPSEIIRMDGRLNELTFTTIQRSIEGDCADIDNPSNWVKLMQDSYLRLMIAQEGSITLSNALSYMYDTLENTGALATEFVIPGGATDEELSAMLQVAAAVGASFPFRDDLDITVSTAESNHQVNKLHVGINIPNVIPLPALTAGQGFLASDRQNGINRLVVTGADAQGLNRAVRVLGNARLLSDMQQQAIIIKQDVPRSSQAQLYREDGYYTLDDFGYSNVNMAGAFHQQTNFTLQQPGGMISANRSYIEVIFRHSEALISDNSLLTLYINGSPAGSAKLSASNAREGRLKVTIPQDALNSETINIRIDVYNYLGKLDCSKDYYDTAWTVIENASVVYFEPGTKPITPSLLNFPKLSGDTCVIIADQSSLALGAAAAMRGGQQNGQTVWLAEGFDALENPRKDADYLILSDNQSLSLPLSIENVLPIIPRNGQDFDVKEETGLISAVLADKLVVQVIRAPWSASRRIYLITYPAGGEQTALTLLSQRAVTENLTEQVAMISEAGAVSTLNTAQVIEQTNPPMTWERLAYLVKTKTGYSIELILALIAGLLVIVLVIVRVSVNRSRFKHAAEGVQGQNKQPEKPTQPTNEAELFPDERFMSRK